MRPITMSNHAPRIFRPQAIAATALSLILAAPAAWGQGVTPLASDMSLPRLGAATAMPEDEILARVNGRVIPKATIDTVFEQLPADAPAPERDFLVSEIIDMEVLAQEAERSGLHLRPDVAARLVLQYTQTLANEWIDTQAIKISNDAEALRERYDAFVAELPEDEYRASHILVESKEQAQELIADIAAGADFLEIASEHSLDSNAHLGWISDDTGVPEVSTALATLDTGAVTQEPVETDFGFHILRLDESRRAPKPDFDSIKPTIVDLVVTERLRQELESLREAADIEIN